MLPCRSILRVLHSILERVLFQSRSAQVCDGRAQGLMLCEACVEGDEAAMSDRAPPADRANVSPGCSLDEPKGSVSYTILQHARCPQMPKLYGCQRYMGYWYFSNASSQRPACVCLQASKGSPFKAFTCKDSKGAPHLGVDTRTIIVPKVKQPASAPERGASVAPGVFYSRAASGPLGAPQQQLESSWQPRSMPDVDAPDAGARAAVSGGEPAPRRRRQSAKASQARKTTPVRLPARSAVSYCSMHAGCAVLLQWQHVRCPTSAPGGALTSHFPQRACYQGDAHQQRMGHGGWILHVP